MRKFLTVAVAALLAGPAVATSYELSWLGAVTLVEGDLPGNDVKVDDAMAAAFIFNDEVAADPTLLPLGGGTYSIYSAPVVSFHLLLGSYAVSASNRFSNLICANDSFGADGIVFTFEGLPGGPFSSTFGSVQLQARGPSDAIGGNGLAEGLPYSRFQRSFFAIFGDGTRATRVFGTLALAQSSPVPEPATWISLGLGLSAMGAMMRGERRTRRRQRTIPTRTAEK